MADETTDHEVVTDDDVQAIIDRAEAGVSDLLAAYEPIERHYFAAATVNTPTVTYAIDTNPR